MGPCFKVLRNQRHLPERFAPGNSLFPQKPLKPVISREITRSLEGSGSNRFSPGCQTRVDYLVFSPQEQSPPAAFTCTGSYFWRYFFIMLSTSSSLLPAPGSLCSGDVRSPPSPSSRGIRGRLLMLSALLKDTMELEEEDESER